MKKTTIPFCRLIPDTWVEVPNRFLLKDHSKKVGDKFGDYQLLSLTTSGVKEKDSNSSGGKVPESYEGYQTVEKGDLIFCLFDLDCSAVFSGLSDFDGMITSAYDVFHPVPKYVEKHYLDYWFQFVFSNRYYKMFSKNIRYTVTREVFNSIHTPVPPLSVQKRIGELLDLKCAQIDALIANQEQQIEKLKQYKQALITETVTKGLDLTIPMKDSGVEWIGEIPETWETKPLKYLFSFGKGLPITKADLVENGVKVVSYGQIHAKYNLSAHLDEKLFRFVPKSICEANPFSLVNKGDFIFADTSEDIEGSGDFVYIDQTDSIFAGYHTITLFSKTNINNQFLAYLFMSEMWKKQIWSKVCGVKVFSLSRSILSRTSVLFPSVEEQDRICSFLDEKSRAFEREIAIKQSKIEKLNQYKKSLIYEYVTGKKEVKTYA